MQLSSKERKYRNKIIAENHLKKEAQRYLDQYIKSKSLTYKSLYLNYGFLHSMLTQYSLNKLGNAMKNIGSSLQKATKAMMSLSTTLQQCAKTINLKEDNEEDKIHNKENDIYLVTGVEDGWIKVDEVWQEYLEAKERLK